MAEPRETADAAILPPAAVLFGALRSGTTMLRLMLDHHLRLTCPGETDFLADALVAPPAAAGPEGWHYDLQALEGNRIFRASRATLPDVADARRAFAQMVRDLHGGRGDRVVLVAHRGLDRLLALCPDLPVLHLVRDPRDVARSAIGMGWAGNVYYGVDTWLGTERLWDRVAPGLAPSQVREVRYEALVQDPAGTLTDVCAFLGLPYDPAMLAYDGGSTYDAPDPRLIEQWRRKQTPREVGLVEGRLGPLLAARGYAPSGAPVLRPGPLDRLRLWAGNKAGTWAHRVARYGVLDPLAVAIARRTGLKAMARGAQRRIDEKVIARLK